jgi:hypothetical protein
MLGKNGEDFKARGLAECASPNVHAVTQFSPDSTNIDIRFRQDAFQELTDR